MLNVQRHRGVSQFDDEVAYTRKWMWVHMILGAAMVAVFLFHQVLGWFAGAAGWYALSLVVMYGFMIEHQICRLLLALLFLGGAAGGVYFINVVFPTTQAPPMPIIPPAVIPLLVGLACMTYVVTGLVLLFNSRIRKAGQVGFSLW